MGKKNTGSKKSEEKEAAKKAKAAKATKADKKNSKKNSKKADKKVAPKAEKKPESKPESKPAKTEKKVELVRADLEKLATDVATYMEFEEPIAVEGVSDADLAVDIANIFSEEGFDKKDFIPSRNNKDVMPEGSAETLNSILMYVIQNAEVTEENTEEPAE